MKRNIERLLLIVSVLLSGCGSKDSKDKLVPAGPSRQVVQQQQVQSSATIDVKRSFSWKKINFKKIKYKLNQYIITANLEEGSHNGETLKCSLFNNNGVTNIESKFEKNSSETYIFLDIDDDHSLEKATLNCLVEDAESKKLGELKKDIPKDHIVKGKVEINKSIFALANNFNVGILYFDKDSHFDISSRTLSIQAEGVLFENSSVESYVDGNVTLETPGTGHSGGQLNLKADYLYGDVIFQLNGQKAGDYDSHSNEVPAKQGKQGVDGCAVISLGPPNDGSIPKSSLSGSKCECLAGSGGVGTDGKRGRKGFQGGDTGLFQIEVTIDSDIQISNNSIPGEGSDGELGQPGGAGGPPGRNAKSNEELRNFSTFAEAPRALIRSVARNQNSPYCRSYQAKSGPKGKDGDRGIHGDSGDKRKSSFIKRYK